MSLFGALFSGQAQDSKLAALFGQATTKAGARPAKPSSAAAEATQAGYPNAIDDQPLPAKKRKRVAAATSADPARNQSNGHAGGMHYTGSNAHPAPDINTAFDPKPAAELMQPAAKKRKSTKNAISTSLASAAATSNQEVSNWHANHEH